MLWGIQEFALTNLQTVGDHPQSWIGLNQSSENFSSCCRSVHWRLTWCMPSRWSLSAKSRNTFAYWHV